MSEHKHRAMIKEWIKDTSRPVETRHSPKDIGLSEWELDCYPIWNDDSEYRFADKHKEREVVSSLTDKEIIEILRLSYAGKDTDHCQRILANAAAQREREDIKNMPAKTNLMAHELESLFKQFEGEISFTKKLQKFSNAVIAHFLKNL